MKCKASISKSRNDIREDRADFFFSRPCNILLVCKDFFFQIPKMQTVHLGAVHKLHLQEEGGSTVGYLCHST